MLLKSAKQQSPSPRSDRLHLRKPRDPEGKEKSLILRGQHFVPFPPTFIWSWVLMFLKQGLVL